AKVMPGITLEVIGQDGLGYAPVTKTTADELHAQLAGWNGAPELDRSWRTIGEYLDRVDEGAPVNVAHLVPHGNVRMNVLGGENRPPTRSELERMVAEVAQGMAEGAPGISTGAHLQPGTGVVSEGIIA